MYDKEKRIIDYILEEHEKNKIIEQIRQSLEVRRSSLAYSSKINFLERCLELEIKND
jgi:hypothetical protein